MSNICYEKIKLNLNYKKLILMMCCEFIFSYSLKK